MNLKSMPFKKIKKQHFFDNLSKTSTINRDDPLKNRWVYVTDVFNCNLCRYAYLYPERLEDVRNMLDYINSSGSLDSVPERKKQIAMTVQKKIWLMKNNEGLIPLQLAAKFGQDQIFKDIMELPVSSLQCIYMYINMSIRYMSGLRDSLNVLTQTVLC